MATTSTAVVGFAVVYIMALLSFCLVSDVLRRQGATDSNHTFSFTKEHHDFISADAATDSNIDHINANDDSTSVIKLQDNISVKALSWKPRIFLFENFLSKEECEHLMAISAPTLQKSTVADTDTGKNVDLDVRTSHGTFLALGQDEIVREIEERIALVSQIPKDHGEPLQVLRYQVGQKYDAHYDFFFDKYNADKQYGGNRMATMLMYLSDVEVGGETVFPSVELDNDRMKAQQDFTPCGKEGLAVKPKQGSAILFWGMRPDTTLDHLSLHGSCPVVQGNKWVSTKWMRVDKRISRAHTI